MILPNKLISLNNSIAYKSIFIIDKVKAKLYKPAELYVLLSENFEDINIKYSIPELNRMNNPDQQYLFQVLGDPRTFELYKNLMLKQEKINGCINNLNENSIDTKQFYSFLLNINKTLKETKETLEKKINSVNREIEEMEKKLYSNT